MHNGIELCCMHSGIELCCMQSPGFQALARTGAMAVCGNGPNGKVAGGWGWTRSRRDDASHYIHIHTHTHTYTHIHMGGDREQAKCSESPLFPLT